MFEQFGVNKLLICKSASTLRLKSKTIALQYVGTTKTLRSRSCFSEFLHFSSTVDSLLTDTSVKRTPRVGPSLPLFIPFI